MKSYTTKLEISLEIEHYNDLHDAILFIVNQIKEFGGKMVAVKNVTSDYPPKLVSTGILDFKPTTP